jgi:phosphonoacetaldehyde hydrolase
MEQKREGSHDGSQAGGGVKAVILDWAGTTVDFGCVAPAAVFVDIFKKEGVEITVEEARGPMGLAKKDHIRALCAAEGIRARWQAAHGKVPGEVDVERLYASFTPALNASILHHSDLVPGTLEFAAAMRKRGIKIGSTTGYSLETMEILREDSKKRGYEPDALVSPSEVPAGRPFPWMCYLNAIKLGTYPMRSMVKIGDTVADIREGLNAGMWAVGLAKSGNEIGLTMGELLLMDPQEFRRRLDAAYGTLRDAGAHYVVDGIWDCLGVIDDIDERLKGGMTPLEDKQERQTGGPFRNGRRRNGM